MEKTGREQSWHSTGTLLTGLLIVGSRVDFWVRKEDERTDDEVELNGPSGIRITTTVYVYHVRKLFLVRGDFIFGLKMCRQSRFSYRKRLRLSFVIEWKFIRPKAPGKSCNILPYHQFSLPRPRSDTRRDRDSEWSIHWPVHWIEETRGLRNRHFIWIQCLKTTDLVIYLHLVNLPTDHTFFVIQLSNKSYDKDRHRCFLSILLFYFPHQKTLVNFDDKKTKYLKKKKNV